MKTNKNLLAYLSFISVGLVAILAIAPSALAQDDIIPDSSSEIAAADTTDPSDVESVVAMSDDGEVTLSWDVATDDVEVTGYKIYYGTVSITEPGESYEFGPIDTGNKITHTIENLDNGTTYFFSVTAYDAAANESVNYSVEVSATPLAGAADSESPKVVSAIAVDKNAAKVMFSEEVVLPSVGAESAFSVNEDLTQAPLEVTAAMVDPDDSTAVILTTGDQSAGVSYIVTAGIQVEDKAGNPIVSGTSDISVFTGTDLVAIAEPETPEDTTAPEMTKVTATSDTSIDVSFSEPIVLGIDPTENFLITEETNLANVLDVADVTQSPDGATVTLTTAPQTPQNYNLIVVDVADAAGNLISLENNATVFMGGIGEDAPVDPLIEDNMPEETVSAEDAIPPEDVTNLASKLMDAMMVSLSWTGSANSSGDLANYVLYKSTNGVDYTGGVVLNLDAVEYTVGDLVADMNYYFKITSVDITGNESEGVVTGFKLPATGPGLLLLLGGSLGFGRVLTRRKKFRK